MQHTAPRTRRVSSTHLLVASAVLIATGMVARTSLAAFTATTTNPSNHWATATVSLTNDHTGSALFTAAGLVPGNTGTTCVVVHYTGTAAADVRLYATLSNDTLSQYLTMAVVKATGTYTGCAAYPGGPTAVYNGALSAFPANWTGGAQLWQPAGDETVTYRITYTLQDNNAAQGKAVDAVFTWEARSV